MKKIVTIILTLAMFFSLAACGGSSAKKEEAGNVYNELVSAFNETGTYMNENIDYIDQTVVDDYNKVAAQMEEILTHLESDENLGDETYDQLIAEMKELIAACKEDKTMVEEFVANAQTSVEEEQPAEAPQEVTAAQVLSSFTWELVGGTLGEELWDDATFAQVLDTFGGNLQYTFDMDGNVTQILGSGQTVTGTYAAQDDVELLLDFNGQNMIAAVAGDETGFELYISDMEYASTMILWPVEG